MHSINCETLSEKIPLRADAHGTIRVGNTRVTLSAVISCFDRGATPEAIVDSFNSLQLDDVYCVIAYYLRHEDEVKAYLKQEREEGEARRRRRDRLRGGGRTTSPPGVHRSRLLAPPCPS